MEDDGRLIVRSIVPVREAALMPLAYEAVACVL